VNARTAATNKRGSVHICKVRSLFFGNLNGIVLGIPTLCSHLHIGISQCTCTSFFFCSLICYACITKNAGYFHMFCLLPQILHFYVSIFFYFPSCSFFLRLSILHILVQYICLIGAMEASCLASGTLEIHSLLTYPETFHCIRCHQTGQHPEYNCSAALVLTGNETRLIVP
jgi:hypothetical protein